jgi:hypothetical protein
MGCEVDFRGTVGHVGPHLAVLPRSVCSFYIGRDEARVVLVELLAAMEATGDLEGLAL